MTSHPVFPALAAPHRRASVSKQCAVAGCNAPRYKQNYCIVHVAQLGLDAGSPRSTSPGVISPRDSAPSSGNLAGSPASAMAAVAVAATIAPQSNQQQPARQMTASPAPGQRGGVSTLVNAFNDVALQQQQATRLTRVPSSGMVSPRFKMSDAQPVSPRSPIAAGRDRGPSSAAFLPNPLGRARPYAPSFSTRPPTFDEFVQLYPDTDPNQVPDNPYDAAYSYSYTGTGPTGGLAGSADSDDEEDDRHRAAAAAANAAYRGSPSLPLPPPSETPPALQLGVSGATAGTPRRTAPPPLPVNRSLTSPAQSLHQFPPPAAMEAKYAQDQETGSSFTPAGSRAPVQTWASRTIAQAAQLSQSVNRSAVLSPRPIQQQQSPYGVQVTSPRGGIRSQSPPPYPTGVDALPPPSEPYPHVSPRLLQQTSAPSGTSSSSPAAAAAAAQAAVGTRYRRSSVGGPQEMDFLRQMAQAKKKLAGDRRDSTPGGHHKGTSVISSTSTADSALIAHLRGSSNYRTNSTAAAGVAAAPAGAASGANQRGNNLPNYGYNDARFMMIEQDAEKERKARYTLVTKFVQSESTFVDYLTAIQSIRTKCLQLADKMSLSTVAIDRLFQNIDELIALHRTVLAELQVSSNMAQVFIPFADRFTEVYYPYLRSFDGAMDTYFWLQGNNKKLMDQLNRFRSSCNNLWLCSLLAMPCKRLWVYHQVAMDLLAHTPKDNPLHASATAAVQALCYRNIEPLAQQFRITTENLCDIVDIQQRMLGDPPPLIKPGRVFVREGQLQLVSTTLMITTATYRIFFLFSDVLVWATCEHCKYRDTCNLAGAIVGAGAERHDILIRTTSRNVQLRCKSDEQYLGWMHDLQMVAKALQEHKWS